MLGSQARARQAILGFYRSSPAYRSLLARHADVRTEQDLETLPWDKIPIIDKESFYKTLPVQEAQGIANFLRSSGSSRTDLAGGKDFSGRSFATPSPLPCRSGNYARPRSSI